MLSSSVITDRLHTYAGPGIGILTLICALMGWHVALLDKPATVAVALVCLMFVLTPLTVKFSTITKEYVTFFFAVLYSVGIYIETTGTGLLHPAGFFATFFPFISVVFLGRTAGLINAGFAAGYIGVGFYKFSYFPTPMEAEMTVGVAVVHCMAMLVTMLLGLGISLLFVSQSEAFARQQRETNTKLEEARLEVSKALSNMSNGLLMVSGNSAVRLYNDRVLELFDLEPDDLTIGMPLNQYLKKVGCVAGWDEVRSQQIIDEHGMWMAHKSATRIERQFRDNKILSIAYRPMEDGGAIITYDDVTEAREGQKQIAHMAFHDALTGLPNRRSFADRMTQHSSCSPFALLMIDLDRFKAVNDTLGHAVGDSLLLEVAQRLRGLCGPFDLAFRLGGDELAVLASRDDDGAHALAKAIVDALTCPFQIGEHTISIGGSIGLVVAQHADEPDLLQRKADLALYRAKENGRSRVETYREGMIEEAEQRQRLESDLTAAVEAGQLELYYQPLYDLPDRTLCGFEALVRWRHPERGMVPPAEFIPIAEQNGTIMIIGSWVIEEACRQAAIWPEKIYVSVNVSPVQLCSVDILRQLASAFDRHGIMPRRVEIEITESALIKNNEQIASTLAGLRALGVRIAMDDFGTGHSSLAYLREFVLDRIKIDRRLINTSSTDMASAAVVRAVTTIANDLAIATTAEGVETEEQLENLIALGCGTAQGFFLSKPLDAQRALKLVKHHGVDLLRKSVL